MNSPTPTPTPTPTADDTSTPSSAATAALSTLTDCVRTIVAADVPYALCVMNSGLFALNATHAPPSQLENTSTPEGLVAAVIRARAPEDLDLGAMGVCALRCTSASPLFRASASCCDATIRLRACSLTTSNTTNGSSSAALVECKRVLDASLAFTNHECGMAPADRNLLVLAASLVGIALLAFACAWAAHRRRRPSRQEKESPVSAPPMTTTTATTRPPSTTRTNGVLTALGAWSGRMTRQLGNLLWKNLLLRRRRPLALVLEQSLPLLFVGALVVLANLDALFGRRRDHPRPTSDATASASPGSLVCVGLSPLDPTDLGAPNATMRSFYASGQSVVGLFFLLSLVKFVSSTTAALVQDKELRMRELLRILGLSDAALLAAAGLTHAVLTLPLVLVLAAALKFGGVFPTAPYATLVLLFGSLQVAIAAFAVALAPWFRRARTAAIVSVLAWLLLAFPFFAVQPKTLSTKYTAAVLAPPTAFALAVDDLLRRAQLGTGFAHSMTAQLQAAEQAAALANVPTATAMSLVLLLDAVVLLVLGWYLEQVLPQEYGIRKPWYFIFRWRTPASPVSSPKTTTSTAAVSSSPMPVSPADGDDKSTSNYVPMHDDDAAARLTIHEAPAAVIEPVGADLSRQTREGACLELRELTKVFATADGAPRTAVDRLSLTLYAGQITSLLGHNGAGKTTTLSMLTGLVPPTTGDATIRGLSLRRDTSQFRRLMGVCPQHDVQFPELTVDEHLRFFATIKLVPADDVSGTIDAMLEDVGLTGSRRVRARALSGGQRRKLSVAIALLGHSPLVFLDEPTSGMDPYSRRFTWELLRRQRQGRVIILTTHFMDEADILGDRIAILSRGRLRCVGTSLFLKHRYGAGYNLTLLRAAVTDDDADANDQEDQEQATAERVLAFVREFVPEATCSGDAGAELVIQLPTAASSRFPALLDALETNLGALGLRAYGLSVTTLEDVFLRIAREGDDFDDHDDDRDDVKSLVTTRHGTATSPMPPPAPSGWAQYRLLLRKRLWIGRRDTKALLNAIGIPLLFLALLLALPEIRVASFLPDYATSLPSAEARASCPATDTNATGNVLPEALRQRCETRDFGFCALGLVHCDAAVCCEAADYRSPLYACSTCPTRTPTTTTSPPACFNDQCMRRNGAKLQVALNAFLVSMLVMLAFAFVPAALVAFVVKEKDPAQDSKTLQLISGMRIESYVWANYTHDLAVIAVTAATAIVVLPLAHRALGAPVEVLGVALLVLGHAWCVVPMSYLYARRFERHAAAQTSMLVFGLASGGLLSIFSFLCRVVDFRMGGGGGGAAGFTLSALDRDYLRWLFLLFPGYALNNGIYELATRKITRGSLYGAGRTANPQASFMGLFVGFGKDPRCPACWNRRTPGCCVRGALDVDVALAPIVYLLVEAVGMTALVLFLERRDRRCLDGGTPGRLCSSSSKRRRGRRSESSATAKTWPPSRSSQSHAEDEDLVAERQRVADRAIDSDHAIVLRQVHHRYADDRVALDELSLAIPRGECFGYLGVNGAGKSTTIKLLTSQLRATHGEVLVAGQRLHQQQQQQQQQPAPVIGYCPQFDALHDLLTVREELVLYGGLKGLTGEDLVREVDDKIALLGLTEYRDKLTRGLSGGNKRKVSTALALLGAPPIVILDEPSTGMDPSARRKMWNVLAATRRARRTSIVLTTHSMEECEALCSRVGILVRGRLRGLGTIEHLRQRFGQGFTVDLRLRIDATAAELGALDAVLRDRRPFPDALSPTTRSAMQLTATEVVALAEALGRPDRGREWLGAHSTTTAMAAATLATWPLEAICRWWLREDRVEHLTQGLERCLPGIVLIEAHDHYRRYHVPLVDPSTGAGRRPKALFEALEAQREALGIDEYCVAGTSLEHIFNSMVDDDVPGSVERRLVASGLGPSTRPSADV